MDPHAQLIEVWHPDDEPPGIISDVAGGRLAPDLPEVVVDRSKLFAELSE